MVRFVSIPTEPRPGASECSTSARRPCQRRSLHSIGGRSRSPTPPASLGLDLEGGCDSESRKTYTLARREGAKGRRQWSLSAIVAGSREVLGTPLDRRPHGWQRRQEAARLDGARTPADGLLHLQHGVEPRVSFLAEEGTRTVGDVHHGGLEKEGLFIRLLERRGPRVRRPGDWRPLLSWRSHERSPRGPLASVGGVGALRRFLETDVCSNPWS